MAERIVVNTGPLLALAQGEALDLAGHLPYLFICPGEVRAELDRGAALGHSEIRPPGSRSCRSHDRSTRWLSRRWMPAKLPSYS
jgi:hypothetical protein